MRAYQISAFGVEHLTLAEKLDPQPAAGQVLVRVRAVSLNFRDLLVSKGLYNPRMTLPRVPCSDGAGEVVAIGPGVTTVKPGDRVCGIFMQNWIDGPLTESASKSALGGDIDGVLSELVVLRENGVVPIPDYLSFEEAATLPCAAVTAWNAVTTGFDVAGKTVLIQGTGGVSIFALQFAKALGARVLVISGSDEKLYRAVTMGAAVGTNYRTDPEWDQWARRQCDGTGVDLVVEVSGAGTLDRSVKATRHGGRIALIGVLTGGPGLNPIGVLMRAITVQGIYVGSRAMFHSLTAFLAQHEIHPIIDRVFPFEQAPEAFRHLESAQHFGKVVITV